MDIVRRRQHRVRSPRRGGVVAVYSSIRWIHGQLALTLALAVLMYATSGWFIQYGRLFFPETPTLNETRSVAGLAHEAALEPALEAADAASERAIRLRDSLDIPGRLLEVRPAGPGWRAKFASASQRTELTWRPASDDVQLEIRPASFGPSFTTLHRVHGAHGGAAYLLFAVLVDLVGVAMIVYAITGVILWWKIKRKKRLGLGLLGAGSALTLVWMSLLAWGP